MTDAPDLPIHLTPLTEVHRELGARLIEFGGWLMPVQYGSIIEEHRTVRERVGLFEHVPTPVGVLLRSFGERYVGDRADAAPVAAHAIQQEAHSAEADEGNRPGLPQPRLIALP